MRSKSLLVVALIFAATFTVIDAAWAFSSIWYVKEDCVAILTSDKYSCKSEDCKAILTGDKYSCKTDDCKAILTGDKYSCKSANCKALVTHDKYACGAR